MSPKFWQAIQRIGAKKPTDAPETRPSKATFGIGAVIKDRYRLDAELGRGGMGVVYRAHDLVNNRDVAIKVVNVGEATTSSRAEFIRETQITAQLKHPNIVAVDEMHTVDTGAPEPSLFIVMELVQGLSLDDLRGLTFAQIIDLARQICDALDYAHVQGLVHRDLKPGNVLVEKHGFRYVAKLTDFGLARQRGAAESTTSVAGTVYYVAPEVIAGKPADIGADLYALGVMLYEMVTGRVPFSDFDAQSIFEQHLKASVIPPSHSRNDVPLALESIILRLLAKDPKDRFASAQEVRHALEQVVVAPARMDKRTNLPHFVTGFVGRAEQITQTQHLLESSQLVTLLGDGGIGKTRLALAAGAGLFDQFSDGVWLAELAPWSDPALVPQAVASVLGLREESCRPLVVSLTQSLREKNLLLILDHCEHLIGACAQLVGTILQMCPAVRIIATSTAPLNIPGETIQRVPMMTPTDAARLLSERIGMASSTLSDANIVRVCERLEGNPLAIELVAARAKELSMAQVAEQLARLPVPTIDAVIDWSYGLLNEQARTLLNRLAVFVGGFTAEQAESFSGTGNLDVSVSLAHLVNASFVQTNAERYRMLEPIRRYALARLRQAGEEEIMRRNHRDGFFLLALKAAPNLHSIEQAIWLGRLETEYANLLAALDWTIERPQDANIAFRFGSTLWQFWNERSYWREGRDRLEKILALPHKPTDAAARVQVLIGAGYLAILQTDYATAQGLLEQGLATAREINDQHSLGNAVCGLASLAQARNDYEQAAKLYQEGWEYYRTAGNPWELANALYNLGILKMRKGDHYGARSLFQSSLDAFRQVGDKLSIAQVLSNLGLVAYALEQYADARAFFEKGLVLWRGLTNKFGTANQLNYLGYTALHQGESEQARKFFVEALALFKELNSRRHIAEALYGIAGAIAAQRKYEHAAKLIGAADVLLQVPGASIDTTSRVAADKNWVLARIALDAEAFQGARATGQAMGLEEAIACAVE